MAQDSWEARLAGTRDQAGTINCVPRSIGREEHFYVRSKDVAHAAIVEAVIAAALLPGMLDGLEITLDGPVSPRFLASVDAVHDVYHSWYPRLRKVQIMGAFPAARRAVAKARAGLVFSAGVDSFYSLLKHQEEFTDPAFLRGFEYAPPEARLPDHAAGVVRQAATRAGKGVIEIEHVLRGLLARRGLSWRKLACGCFTATLGLWLSPAFGRIYLGASGTYALLEPGASRPLVDALWSTEGLELVHDGRESTKAGKAALVDRPAVAMQTPRVCNVESPDALNCGRREKSLRTVRQLAAFHALDQCTAFAHDLDLALVERIGMKEEGKRIYCENTLGALEASGSHRELARVVLRVVVGSRRKRQLRELTGATVSGLLQPLRAARRMLKPGAGAKLA